jgi:ribonuclease D
VRDPGFEIVDSSRALRRLAEGLRERGVREIALDLEGESNLHVYGLHVCLVQVFDGTRCHLIDPFALGDPREIALLTEDLEILKVMYDPSSDLSLLVNALGITIKSIFDLSTAAQLLGHRETSLTKVLNAELSVEPVNKKKFQRANWYRRPLDPELLAYAASDVLHLLELKRLFLQRMLEKELLTEFLVQNFKIQDRDYRIDPATRHLRIKNAGRLDRRSQVYLKHFFAAREAQARKLNWPPHNVLANETLLEVARRPPADPSHWRELGRRRGRSVELEGFAEAREAAERELRPQGTPASWDHREEPSLPAGDRAPDAGPQAAGRRSGGRRSDGRRSAGRRSAGRGRPGADRGRPGTRGDRRGRETEGGGAGD